MVILFQHQQPTFTTVSEQKFPLYSSRVFVVMMTGPVERRRLVQFSLINLFSEQNIK